ncbi:type II toxin-antitoxin system RelE/ParE family toxin [Xenorhabdus bovienii]|uniref:type II toxin-antitoxin system RelE family toxin n=1 Tax=Xenorhabdus bovienii TaxID=40576 RepID=UPI00237C82C1|nr:type II toxin-antitoxin system RelE/ParE family toxin [Xenorhabdus bovienii]MDE1476196.1 type II toxin-antitoxin system RelE/ParE family toxin [Xenorhabdus bovienii]MDE1484125.1 type II toxin-antitoxin system RelE/ParE family toxin [Xenorhabdus bovienii]MDE9437535.1 type II toxin-antitoxin system RelE/ParE family toxin [Xenorhabdus bovienii]MDE9556993.1 type II toxin-antitoxin system RelE/ParE family toxin [Xenorhabdus bovienii]MDE9588208.1 type II toxin-antitoxin system RelE/ParE family to
MTKISWSGRATKDLIKIPNNDRNAINKKIKNLSNYPMLVQLDIKKLESEENKYRLRIGNYRVLFEIQKGQPVIIRIERILRRTSTTY